MTKCFILNGKVINVGDWDYKERVEVTNGDFTVLSDGTLGYEQVVSKVIDNPLPIRAVETDVSLSWTVTGSIVLSTDPVADTLFVGVV